MANQNRVAGPDTLLLTVEDAAVRLGIGRSTAFTLIASGQLPSVRIGHLRRVPVAALQRFVQSLETDAANPEGPPPHAG